MPDQTPDPARPSASPPPPASPAPPAPPGTSVPPDPLDPVLARFGLAARVFHSGELCNSVDFQDAPGFGFLHVVRDGACLVSIPGKKPRRVPGPSFLFFPRPVRHAFLAPPAEPGQPAPAYATMVCATFDFGKDAGPLLLRGLPDLLVIPFVDLPHAGPATELLFAEAFADRPGRSAAVDRLADYFVILLLRHALSRGLVGASIFAALRDDRLATALNAIHDDPARPWTVETLADRAGMSRARFAAAFKLATGTTPLDYLTDFRLSLAQSMLREGKPLKSIYRPAGYASLEAFLRAFTRRFGQSPAQWRKAHTDPAVFTPEVSFPGPA